MIKSYPLTPLLKQFITKGFTKKRRKPNGSIIAKSTVNTYVHLEKLIAKYEEKYDIQIMVSDIKRGTKREIEKEKNYWKRFYRQFGDFLYLDLGNFDNYVGHNFKMIRAFFKWLNKEKGIFTGDFYKDFYAPKEEIPIIVLEPEQLNFLIHNQAFEESLSRTLKRAKDIFVFGCTVALRYSDMANLKRANWESLEGRDYLRVTSQKTHATTRVKIPPYAVEILEKYKKRSSYLLPVPNKVQLNKNIKQLMEAAGWTQVYPKYRMRRGKPIQIYRSKGVHYRFCDHFSSHSMRRTAITTMLRLGLEENLVRKISGHSAGSKEFYRYVEMSQSFMDEETDKIYSKIGKKMLDLA